MQDAKVTCKSQVLECQCKRTLNEEIDTDLFNKNQWWIETEAFRGIYFSPFVV